MKSKSRISEVLSALIDLLFAGILWLVCSLPIITLGAASTALYYAVVKCVRHNRGRLSSTFFSSFRQNFRQATLVWLLFLLYLLIGAADTYAIEQMGFGSDSVLYLFSRIVLLLPGFLFPWIFAFISRFENTIKGSLQFCCWLMMRHLGRTLILALELALALLIVWLLPQIFPLLPGAICLLMSLTIEPVFRQFQTEEENTSIDSWYNE
ncbi:MAG: YesL family protein [Oscillospiraceae bacterium]|nr:YesL family protein [Oscillospiraceae bacterium]